jgi:hypothetical protein
MGCGLRSQTYDADLADNTDLWRGILTGENPRFRRGRRLRKLIPAAERCKNCHAPFSGIGGLAMRVTGRGRYDRVGRNLNSPSSSSTFAARPRSPAV